MCGIAGILGRADQALARAMAERIGHRGPDGAGTWADDGVAFAHRRLAIVDLHTGQQPMTDAAGRYTVCYNGEIYNHMALRGELEAQGVRFRTSSDTETLLEAWAKWGPSCLERLEGMFAFGMWDHARKVLVLARDRWGIKPLHWTRVDGDLLWASEAKAFLAHPGFRPAANLENLRRLHALEFVPGPGTLLEGVWKLRPGTWVEATAAGGFTVPPIPHPRLAGIAPVADGGKAFAADPQAAIRDLAEALTASVQEQLMSDVPLGIVLSGGLDSALVAAAMQAQGREVPSFTVADSPDVPDFQAARALAQNLGTRHHEAFLDERQVLGDLPLHAYHNESTSHSEVFFFPLFRLMGRHVKVGLCGQGADELWGGYARYKDPATLLATREAALVRGGAAPTLVHKLRQAHANGETLARWDQGDQLADFQLRLVDRSSMAHSVEVRVPFLSHRLQALSDQAPWDWKVRDGVEKWVLRQAAATLGLPEAWARRPKLPAGRATAPGVLAAFEAAAAKAVEPGKLARHPLAATLASPAAYLMHRAWEETMLHGADPARIDLLALG